MLKSIASYFFLALFFISSSTLAENIFEKNYQSQSPKGFKSFSENPQPKVMRGWEKESDNIKMLENGFDLMGTSGFVGKNVPPSVALKHAKKIKADMVLIYDRQINENTRASQIQKARAKAREANRIQKKGEITEITITEEDLADSNAKYDFYLTYWVKLPKPTFGTHFIKLSDSDDNKGIQVIAVIKESAAEAAGIKRGDNIISVNGAEVNSPDDLIKIIQKNKGKSINVAFERGGESIKVSVSL
jgi:membrane-associated protease RseP (regulator of RpoE activity)